MSEIKFYVSEKKQHIEESIRKHEGFENKSAYINHCVEFYLKTKNFINDEQQKKVLNNLQNNKKYNDFISKSIILIENVAREHTSTRKMINDLNSGKLEPEVVVCAIYICEKIPAIFRNTKEIKTTVDYTKKHVITKNDAYSKTRYKQIMDLCPSMIKKNLEEERIDSPLEILKQRTQSKIYEYPKPPALSDIPEDDELIEESEYQREQEEKELEEGELTV